MAQIKLKRKILGHTLEKINDLENLGKNIGMSS